MINFFETFTETIIPIIIVIAVTVVLRILTNFFLKKLESNSKPEKLRKSSLNLKLINYILNAFWLVLACFVIYYLSTSEDSYAFSVFTQDLKLVLYISLVAIATIVSASYVNFWILQTIKQRKLNESDTTNLRFLRYALAGLIYLLGFFLIILAFPSFRSIAQTVLGGAGILAIVVAVSSQEALSNIVSGFFIIIFKPFKVGDLIEIESAQAGIVEDITLRHTVIRNFDNKMIVIPNAIINKAKLVNANMGELKCCERIEIRISYDSDIDLAKKIIQNECENHSLIIDNRTLNDKKNKKPIVKTAVTNLGDFAVTIRAWAWVANVSNAYQIRRDIYESTKKRFDKEGIEIPFPYRTVMLKKK